MLIDNAHPELSISRQADLLGIARSTIYYSPKYKSHTRELMNEIDELYTEFPYFGSRRMRACLQRKGHKISRKKVRNLMIEMGLETIYCKPHLSKAHPDHKVYPYLLRNLEIREVNQVWATDITYIKIKNGSAYLTAILDWFSRYVVAWKLSNSLDTAFCVRCLEKALTVGKPQIFNTDQGSQFTSKEFTNILKNNKIRISMDGRGRCMDNIFTERLWRSVKYEEVYINDYSNIKEAKLKLEDYFCKYNHQRPHQSLNYKMPVEVHFNNKIN